MTSANPTLEAIELLKTGRRREAAALIARDLRTGPPSGERWRSVGRLAAHIGEIEMALDAAKRFAATEPATLERHLNWVGELATFGRADEAMAALLALPASTRAHPAALHLEATLHAERGEDGEAQRLFREAIARSPGYSQSWFPLAMTKKFMPGDPDLAALKAATAQARAAPPTVASQHFYALGKAYQDLGERERAFDEFERGASLRREIEPYDRARMEAMARRTVETFSAEALASLRPSTAPAPPALFVNGLPRSGSTLVEQILTSHSAVDDGAEVNLVRAALVPTVDFSMTGAQRLEARASDPWTEIAEDYARMIAMRFRTDRLSVDKTLNQSFLMGLLLHAMPQARVVWMRRRPEDNALSCFTTSFATPVPWSWSLADIGHFFSLDNLLFEHWRALFPEQILVVPYEELVAEPQAWVERILAHCGLPFEPGVMRFHESQRAVRTASTQQVRQPISAARVGSADAYRARLQPFFDHYRA